MWQKVDPRGLRVWVTKSRASERIAKNKAQSSDFFVEDINLRKEVELAFPRVGISKTVIRKTDKEWEVILFTAKAGVIMGKDWAKLKKFQDHLVKKYNKDYKVILKEIKLPELSAKIMAEFVATQIEWRIPFRKVAKNLLEKVMTKWASWIKVQIAWRLWWTDIARSEKFIEGRVPLQTLRADIDYHYTIAMTKYWVIWVKVWICKWEMFAKAKKAPAATESKKPMIERPSKK